MRSEGEYTVNTQGRSENPEGRARISAAVRLAAVLLVPLSPVLVQAAQTQTAPPDPTPVFKVQVIATTPLPGVGLSIEEIPAPVQTLNAQDLEQSGALDLADLVNRRLTGVHVSEIQGNPFQPDVSYRGYTASPLLGTPQGVSIYMDGVRLNQPFGDVVSWDLIPRLAIASTVLMPGSNPLFGLNTLGGALSIQTKDGRSHPGTMVQATYGNHRRRMVEFEHGGSKASGLNWYLAGNLFGERGWRVDSPSDVRQLFGALGWQEAKREIKLTVSHANTELTGNGLQEQRLLDRDFASVYTRPDTTNNRATLVSVAARRSARNNLTFSGNALLPRHPDGCVQRRHQRRLARPADLPAWRGGARGARRRRVHRRAGERRHGGQYAVSVLALHRQRAAARRAG